MIAFPGMLVAAAQKAGMRTPEDPDEKFNPDEFPHFDVFCKVQLCRPVAYHGEHWDNARVVASLTDEEVRTATLEDLVERGLSFVH